MGRMLIGAAPSGSVCFLLFFSWALVVFCPSGLLFLRARLLSDINYLLLRALRRVSVGHGPFAGEAGRLFRHLSKAVGNALFSAHVTTGTFWEQ
jgi:hypothetical protein